jgi:hypothetical protein
VRVCNTGQSNRPQLKNIAQSLFAALIAEGHTSKKSTLMLTDEEIVEKIL